MASIEMRKYYLNGASTKQDLYQTNSKYFLIEYVRIFKDCRPIEFIPFLSGRNIGFNQDMVCACISKTGTISSSAYRENWYNLVSEMNNNVKKKHVYVCLLC